MTLPTVGAASDCLQSTGGSTTTATTLVFGACGSGTGNIVQAPTSNTPGAAGANVIQPATTGINGLTVNGTTTGTAATALVVAQTGAADSEDITTTTSGSTALAITANSLTTGSGITVTSSGTGLTSGSLLGVSSATTGAVTNGIVALTASGAYTGTGGLLNVTGNSTTSGNVANVSGTGVTTGNIVTIQGGTGLTSGSALNVTASGTSAIANGVVQITHSGAFTGTGGLLAVAGNATTAGTVVNVSGNALTTGVGLNIGSTGTGLTSGSLLNVTSATTGAVATNGIVALQATANYTSTANAGLLDVLANSTTAGTIEDISGSALTTGNGLVVGVNALTTGQGINLTSTETTALTTGALLGITANNATTPTNGLLQLAANGLTTGIGVGVTSTGTGITTGSLLRVSSGTTSAINTNGVVALQATGNYTSTGNNGLLDVQANSTTAGTVTDIQANGLTTGVGLDVASSSTGLTTGSVLSVSSATTGAVNTNGIVLLQASANYTSTGNNGLLDVQANSTTAGTIEDVSGTALTTGTALNIVGTGLTTGSALAINGGSGKAISVTGGTTSLQTSTNSNVAFQVQDAGGDTALDIDTTTANLVLNPDFEATNTTTGWTATGTGASRAENTTAADVYQGNGSLSVTTGTSANSGAVYTFGTGPGVGTYTLSFYAMASSANTSAMTDLTALIAGGGAPTCTLTSNTVSMSGFQRYSCTFTTSGSAITTITIGETGTTSHVFYLDAVSLVSGSALSPFGVGNDQLLGVVNSPVALESASNSTTAFSVENAAAAPVLLVNTTNSNLFTNPGFETGVSHWAADAGANGNAIALNTNPADAYEGQSSLAVTLGTSANAGAETTSALGGYTALAASTTYTLSFYAAGSTSLTGLAVGFTGSNLPTCTLSATAVPSLSTGFQQYSCTFTTVSGVSVTAITITATTVSQTMYLDAFQLVASATLQPYQVGSIQLRGVVTSPTTFQSASNSTTAFQIQNASGSGVLSVDTGHAVVSLGQASSITGQLSFLNSGGANAVGLQAGSASAGYTLTLPTTGPSVNQCLAAGASTATNLVFSACNAGTTLQTAYNNSSTPANITLADGKDFTITAPDTTTDPNIVFTLSCQVSCGSNGRFAVQTGSSPSDVFLVSPSGQVRIGSSSNNVTYSASTGEPTLTGTAEHTRLVTIPAEYAGATFAASGTNNSGTMTATNMTTSPFRNYYDWKTTQPSAQNYDIWVKVPLPTDFTAFPSGQEICLDVYASATTADTIKLTMYDTTNTAVTLSTSDLTPTSATTWQNKCSSSITSGTYTANNDMTLDFTLTAPATTGEVRIGDITYSYLSKF
ncbi:MAG TPA: hypothetical protein VMS08_03945 [Candidatus Saccharimonadia bacterium]|nr:hypothetical protein [Candidatus Saccharimonadia bacterium]